MPNIAASVGSKEHAPLPRPQERNLPRAVARRMDRPLAAGDRNLLAIVDLVLNLGRLDDYGWGV